MYNKNLRGYIQEKLAAGYSTEVIRNALYRWGYNITDVDEAIFSLNVSGLPGGVSDMGCGPYSLLFKPRAFFANKNNFNFKKSLKYFFNSFLIVLLVQVSLIFVIGFLNKQNLKYVFAVILTQTSTDLLFVVSLLMFFGLLIMIYFLLFVFVFKIYISLPSLIILVLFSLLPYILLQSTKPILLLYNALSLFSVSVGFFDINIFFVWSFVLFSFGVAKKLNIDLKKSLFFMSLPFVLFVAILILVFYNIIKINVLFWPLFGKF